MTTFDPYYVWLGIPPKHQPPNHYRLLGIELYEDNADVIDAAANRQTSYLHDMASGPNRKYSQDLLNEIAGARRCLLDVERKQKYDAKLRSKSDQPAAPASETANSNDQAANADVSTTDSASDGGTSAQASQAESPAVESLGTPSTDPGDAATIVSPTEPGALKKGVTADKKARQQDGGQDWKKRASGKSSKLGKSKSSNEDASLEKESESKKSNGPIIIAACGLVCLISIIAVLMSGGEGDPEDIVKGVKSGDKKQGDKGSKTNGTTSILNTPVDKNLLAYFKFELPSLVSALDETENLCNADLHGTPLFVKDGPVGNAIQLDGKDDRIDVLGFATQPNQGSISFWMRSDSNAMPENVGILASKAKDNPFAIKLVKGRLITTFGASGIVQSESVLEPKHWYHVAVAWNAQKVLQLSCNGAKLAESKIAGLNISGIQQFGLLKTNTDQHSAISLDEVQFSKVLVTTSSLKTQMADVSVTVKPPKKVPLVVKTDVKPLVTPQTDKPKTTKKKGNNKNKKNKKPVVVAPPVKIEEPAGRDQVLFEFWKSVPGKTVADLRKVIAQPPSGFLHLRQLKSDPTTATGNVGRRLRGLLVPPASGRYTFTVKFNSPGQFLLSSTNGPEKLAEVKEATVRRLSDSNVYYFEIVQKQNKPTDTFNIGWKRPGGEVDDTIGAPYLTWKAHYRSFITIPFTVASQPKIAFKQAADHSQTAVGLEQTEGAVYTVSAKVNMDELSAIRIETLPDDSLPKRGPGLRSGGIFSITEIKGSYKSPGQASQPITFQVPLVDMSSTTAKALIDNDLESSWSMRNRAGMRTSILLIPTQPLRLAAASELTLSIHQHYNIGRFRLRATSMDSRQATRVVEQQRDYAVRKRSYFVNMGATANIGKYKDGNSWVASKAYRFGDWGFVGKAKSRDLQAVKDPIQKTTLEGLSKFQFTVPNGTYLVRLHFSENYVTAAGMRVFKVKIEDSREKTIDVFKSAGGAQKLFSYPASSRPLSTRVSDGLLEIQFMKVVGEPFVNAISIEAR